MNDSISEKDTDQRIDFAQVSALVVDDNIHMRRLVADILQAFGLGKIHEASNGQEALQLMRTNNVQIVLCDWMMDNLNGIELLQEIRKANTEVMFQRVAFIMMTAHDDEERIWRAKEAGATAILVKPFSTAALYERLLSAAESVFRKPRPNAATGTTDFMNGAG